MVWGSPHFLRLDSFDPVRPIPYASSSPKAGERESPHLPLGNSSHSWVLEIYDLLRFLQKMGRTSSSRRPNPSDCFQGRACFRGRCDEGSQSNSSKTMRVACARFMV